MCRYKHPFLRSQISHYVMISLTNQPYQPYKLQPPMYIIIHLLVIYLTRTDKPAGQGVSTIPKDKDPHKHELNTT